LRVIICGSRNWTGVAAVERIHHTLLAVEMLCTALNSPLQLVHGDCPIGADAIADRWARRRDYDPILFPADWNKYGRAAGPIRNEAMAKAGAHLCIAFLRDNSDGTTNMISNAQACNIATFIVPWGRPVLDQPSVGLQDQWIRADIDSTLDREARGEGLAAA
jgi:YspA, cpYpsA-related SLOG family